MKNFIDGFYEVLHKNTQRRRRMFSLLLVLSIFVTSGVVWGLRGTGITLVNQELCGIEAHTHTDACYERTLMCTLPEDENHTHTEECYDTHCICEITEHQHNAECYTDTLPEDTILLENTVSQTVNADEVTVFEGTHPTEEASDGDETTADEPNAAEKPMLPLRAVNPHDKGTIPYTLLPNTRELDIVINLFDYGTQELDSSDSHYGNPQNVGINQGKTLDNDILFFAYGTPATPLIEGNDQFDLKNIDKQRMQVDENGRVRRNLTKNHYSGDYRTDTDANGKSMYVSGNRPVQGIVNNTLTNGYPTIAGSNHSLDYLFNTQENGNVKRVYQNVGGLLQKDSNQYYYYDSNDNYVYYNPAQGNNGNFVIYDGTFQIDNDDHNQTKNPMAIGFFPFDDYDDTKKDPNWNGSKYNHHFGMTLTANFQIPNNENYQYQGQDVIFEYSGDDDMWVFVDGVLVLDVGGIHEPASGKINFSSGDVLVQDEAFGTNNIDGKRWNEYTLEGLFEAAGKTWTTTAEHHIDMFYLERGGCYSNLSMMFNLPTIKTISVSKDLEHSFHPDKDYDNEAYSFRLHQKTSVDSLDDEIYTGYYEHDGQYTSLADTEGVFTIQPGANVSFHGLDPDKYYYVEELRINSSIFSDILVNGDIVSSLQADSGLSSASTQPTLLDKNLNYNFSNRIRENSTNIEVHKNWIDGEKPHNNDKVLFRLIRINEANEENVLVVNGRMTFVLNASNHWKMSFNNLVTRYGMHTYSYRVEEVNVPMGYTVSYVIDENENEPTVYNINNTLITQTEIHIEKVWLDSQGNTLDNPPEQIHAKLTRHFFVYDNPATAPLVIKVQNQNGNLIGRWKTYKTFLGGSIDFSLTMPTNGTILSCDSQNCNALYSDNAFCASNIQNNAEVTITISFQGETQQVLQQNSFTESTEGWIRFNESASRHSSCPPDIQGPLEVLLSGAQSYATGNALLVRGREGGYNQGAQTTIPKDVMEPGKSYGFSLYAYANSNTNPEFHLVLKYYSADNKDHYEHIADVSTNSQNWAHLYNPNYTMPSDWDKTKETIVYVETAQGHAEFDNYYLDEFLITDGGTADIGANTINPIVHESFNTQADGVQYWSKRGDETVAHSTAAAYGNGGGSVLVSDRQENWNGAQRQLDKTQYASGTTHNFQIYAMSPTADTTFKFELQYNDKTKAGNNKTQYVTMATASAKAGEWVLLSNPAYTMPANIDTNERLAIYVNTENGTANFYIDEFVESPIGSEATVLPETGEVIINRDDFGVNLFEDTIYAPKKVESEGEDDNFNNAHSDLVLNAANHWKMSWEHGDLNEDPHYTYTYSVTELDPDLQYVVSYVGNGTSSNTEDNPILICNTLCAYVLPATGGIGTKRFILIGLAMILLSMLGFGIVRRRERRSE